MLLKPRDYLVYCNKFFNDDEIELIQKHVSTLSSHDGEIGVDNVSGSTAVVRKIRDSSVKWICHDEEVQWLWNKMRLMINEMNNNFFHFDIGACSDLQHTTYTAPGGHYGVHADENAGSYPQRKISFSIQLSDPSEYEGGDVLIYNNNIKNPYKASKNKGDLILFQSLTLHEVTPVTSGTRRSLVGWVSGPPFK